MDYCMFLSDTDVKMMVMCFLTVVFILGLYVCGESNDK